MGHGPQGVRPGAAGHELQIGVDQRVTQCEPGVATRRRRSNEAGKVSHRGMLIGAGGRHADVTRITRVLGVLRASRRPGNRVLGRAFGALAAECTAPEPSFGEVPTPGTRPVVKGASNGSAAHRTDGARVDRHVRLVRPASSSGTIRAQLLTTREGSRLVAGR